MSLINPKTVVGAIGVAILMGGVASAQAQDPIVINDVSGLSMPPPSNMATIHALRCCFLLNIS